MNDIVAQFVEVIQAAVGAAVPVRSGAGEQTDAAPYVVVEELNAESHHNMNGPAGLTFSLVEATYYAATPKAAKDLSLSAKQPLYAARPGWIQAIYLETEYDLNFPPVSAQGRPTFARVQVWRVPIDSLNYTELSP